MFACALTEEKLEEQTELEDKEEVSVCVFGLRTRSERTEKRFLVSGINFGCWLILAGGDVLALFFFLSTGGEKENTDVFLLGRAGKSIRDAFTSELFAIFIEAALLVLLLIISSPKLQIDE